MFAHIWAYAIRPYIYRQFTGNMLVLLDEDSSEQAVFRRKTVGGGIEYALVWAETKLTQPQQSQDFIEQV